MGRLDYAQSVRHFAFAAVAGVVGAFASIVLCLCVGWSRELFEHATWLLWVLPVLGVLEVLLYKWFKLPQTLTTHQVILQMREDKAISPLLAPGILIGTCLTMLGGGSVGKEAGALHMGASLGTLVSRPFKIKSVYRKNSDEKMDGYVAAVGMAATFSALFFAPLGSAMFVVELSRFKRSIGKHAFSIVFACFIAYFIASAIGIGDVIDSVEMPAVSWPVVGQCVVVGVGAALAGTVFDSAIHWVHDLTLRIRRNFFLWVIVGGLLYALLIQVTGWFDLTGSGGKLLNDAMHGTFQPWDFAVRLLLPLICLGFWFRGGEIMPSFCIGGLLGASCTFLTGGDAAFGAAVGVVAFFAAFSRCPFAAFLMGCEIFGWAAAPFFAIGIVVAYMFGYPVGMYGDGVDHIIRNVSHKKMQTIEKNIAAELRPGDLQDPLTKKLENDK